MLIKLTILKTDMSRLINTRYIVDVEPVQGDHSTVALISGDHAYKITVKESIEEIAEIQYNWLHPAKTR